MRLTVGLARAKHRRAAAAVELAFLLPLLLFLLLLAIDFARIYYYSLTITNGARCGAMYGSSHPVSSLDSAGIEAATRADMGNVSPSPAVASQLGVDASSSVYIEVTVTYQFETIVKYPGIPGQMELTRTVRMRVAPILPAGS